jgi:hypothetical protein
MHLAQSHMGTPQGSDAVEMQVPLEVFYVSIATLKVIPRELAALKTGKRITEIVFRTSDVENQSYSSILL